MAAQEGYREGDGVEGGQSVEIHSLFPCASSEPRWEESRFTLFWRFRGNRRPIESKIKRSVWVGFFDFFHPESDFKRKQTRPMFMVT